MITDANKAPRFSTRDKASRYHSQRFARNLPFADIPEASRKRTLTNIRPYTDGRMFPRDRNLGTTLIEILLISRFAFSSIACCLQLPRNIWTSIVE